MRKGPAIVIIALIVLVALNFIVGNIPKPGEKPKDSSGGKQPTDIEFVDPKIIF